MLPGFPGGAQYQELVEADAAAPVGPVAYLVVRKRERALPGIDEHEIVAQGLELVEPERRGLCRGNAISLPGLRLPVVFLFFLFFGGLGGGRGIVSGK